jgi:hypothetical protein
MRLAWAWRSAYHAQRLRLWRTKVWWPHQCSGVSKVPRFLTQQMAARLREYWLRSVEGAASLGDFDFHRQPAFFHRRLAPGRGSAWRDFGALRSHAGPTRMPSVRLNSEPPGSVRISLPFVSLRAGL